MDSNEGLSCTVADYNIHNNIIFFSFSFSSTSPGRCNDVDAQNNVVINISIKIFLLFWISVKTLVEFPKNRSSIVCYPSYKKKSKKEVVRMNLMNNNYNEYNIPFF